MKYILCFAFSVIIMALFSSCIGTNKSLGGEDVHVCMYNMVSSSTINESQTDWPNEQMRRRLVGTWQSITLMADGTELIGEVTFLEKGDWGMMTCLGELCIPSWFIYQLDADSSEFRTFDISDWMGDIGVNRLLRITRYHLDWNGDDEIYLTMIDCVLRNYVGGEPEHLGYESQEPRRKVWTRVKK